MRKGEGGVWGWIGQHQREHTRECTSGSNRGHAPPGPFGRAKMKLCGSVLGVMSFGRLEVLFPNAAGRYCFRPHWRAREAEILTLAMRAHEKKLRARRVEVLADTTLCKGQSVRRLDSAAEHIVEAHFRQIDVLHMFRQKVQRLSASSLPSQRACLERPVDLIWQFTGMRSLWHPEQLHLAEWQALQQLEFIFNVTLSADGKNIAIAKLAKHKNLSRIDAEMSMEPVRGPARNAFETDDVGGVCDDDDLPVELVANTGLLPPSLSEAEALACLRRDEEVQLAMQQGQGRREGIQNMRQVDVAFGGLLRELQFDIEARTGSRYGGAQHSLQTAIEDQKAQLARLREQEATMAVPGPLEQGQHHNGDLSDVGVQLVEDPELGSTKHMSPVAFAKQLCEVATLNRDQRRPVALIAREMERAWQTEQQRRALLPQAERDEVEMQQWTIPLSGRLCRMLIFGSGGCGKTRLITMVLAPLFKRYFGPRGLVTTAFSNKAARLVNGKTGHAIAKLRGTKSLTMPNLRLRNDQESRALAAVWAPAGALVKDEFSQQSAPLEHALAVRAIYGRCNAHNLKKEEYALPATNWASLPFVITCGDPLQFPPIPASSSLLADLENTSREHRAGEQMFADQNYVCKLNTAMRFVNDPTLQGILEKMRTPGEDRTSLRLTAQEWKVLQNTDIEHRASLDGTEMWHQAGYPWTIVCMAQWVRSQFSAAHHKATLFLCPAKDYIQNVEALDLVHVRNELIKIPNMNKTGRLPGITLLHLHMRVRLTVTVCPRLAPVDSTGTIVAIELEGLDRNRMEQGEAPRVLLLQRQPVVLVRLDESVEDTGLGAGIVAVSPTQPSEPFHVDIDAPRTGASAHKTQIKVKVTRVQVPLVIQNASTLYTLQGATADPGLIFHWRFPAKLNKEMRWLTVYMVLSRVRSLDQLRSVGLQDNVKELINGGPPSGMLSRFTALFDERIAATDAAADAAMTELGW